MTPRINITVPVFNRVRETVKTLLALKKHTHANYSLTVVDNGSDPECAEVLLSLHKGGVIDQLYRLDRNYGVACACNVGFALSSADVYMKLDNDMEVLCGDWMSRMFSVWELASFPSVFGHYQSNQPAGTPTITPRETPAGTLYEHVRVVPGFAFMIPHFVLEHVGFFCEDYGLYGEEDTDYCLRLQVAGIPLHATDMYAFMKEQPYHDVYAARKVNKHRNALINRGHEHRPGLLPCNRILYDYCLKQIKVPLKYAIARQEGLNVVLRENETYKDYRKRLMKCKVAITRHLNGTGLANADALLVHLKSVMQGYN